VHVCGTARTAVSDHMIKDTIQSRCCQILTTHPREPQKVTVLVLQPFVAVGSGLANSAYPSRTSGPVDYAILSHTKTSGVWTGPDDDRSEGA
jgi:hypothetical protein